MLLTYAPEEIAVDNEDSVLPDSMYGQQNNPWDDIRDDIKALNNALFHDEEDGLRGAVRANATAIDQLGIAIAALNKRWDQADEREAKRVEKMEKRSWQLVSGFILTAAIGICSTIFNGYSNNRVHALAEQINHINQSRSQPAQVQQTP